MKILIIEDNKYKLEDIEKFLSSIYPNMVIAHGMSYASGLKKALQDNFDLVITDNSLPCYESTPFDIKQDMAPLVIEELEEYLPDAKVIICSQFDPGEKEKYFNGIMRSYANCIGSVRYDSSDDSWKGSLQQLLSSLS